MHPILKHAVLAAFLAAAMVASAFLLSRLFVRVRHEQAITVKGYAEREVRADSGTFTCTVSARDTRLEGAYARLQDATAAVTTHLLAAGFAPGDLAPGTPRMVKVPRRDAQGKPTNETEYFDGFQNVAVSSTNVLLVRQAAVAVTDLIRQGVDLEASAPEFFIQDLQAVKLALLADATADGCRRAETLARHSGGRVGALQAAQQGVFQITARQSTETSGYGVYDTTTIDKTAKAVVTLQYAIEPAP